MGTPKNPFEIFGLTPEMVGSLAEKDLFSVLKALYRTLLKSVHPDVARKKNRNTNINRAVELNLAFEVLNMDKDPVAFRRYRKQFMALRPRTLYQKSLMLQQELVMGEARKDQLAEAYFQRLVADYGWPEEDPEPARTTANFPLENVRLGLLDVAINQNLKMVSWSVGSNYKEINFDRGGRLTIRGVGRKRFIRANYIHLLGTVPTEELDLLPLLERHPCAFFKTPALAGPGSTGPSISVLNLISQAKFKSHVLTHLKPCITERAYLFSLNRNELIESGHLTLEGLVVKIEHNL